MVRERLGTTALNGVRLRRRVQRDDSCKPLILADRDSVTSSFMTQTTRKNHWLLVVFLVHRTSQKADVNG